MKKSFAVIKQVARLLTTERTFFNMLGISDLPSLRSVIAQKLLGMEGTSVPVTDLTTANSITY